MRIIGHARALLTAERSALNTVISVHAPEKVCAAVPGRFVTTWGTKTYLHSLAMEAKSNIAQATLIEEAGVNFPGRLRGRTRSPAPRSSSLTPIFLSTNIAFGAADMMDAWVSCRQLARW
ncbi:MAG: hypothetical protein WBM08_06975 [Prochlorococcaceae cyanobacterium]